MRFKLSIEVTPQYRAVCDGDWNGERRSSADPVKVNNLFDAALASLESQGFIAIARTPRKNQCRLVTLYDYERCTSPAIVLTITA